MFREVCATSPQSPGPTAVVLRAFCKTEFVCGNLHMLMMTMGPSNRTKTTGAAGVQCSLLPCRLLFTEHKPVATECSGRTGTVNASLVLVLPPPHPGLWR